MTIGFSTFIGIELGFLKQNSNSHISETTGPKIIFLLFSWLNQVHNIPLNITKTKLQKLKYSERRFFFSLKIFFVLEWIQMIVAL